MQSRTFGATQLPFSIIKNEQPGAYLNQDNTTSLYKLTTLQETFIMSINELALQGKHNIYNSMASGIVCKGARVAKQ
jgi:UDP-N-acetylmuramoylalanine--D-glutamate ligase